MCVCSVVQDRGGWYDACQTFVSRSIPTASDPVGVAGSFVCECGQGRGHQLIKMGVQISNLSILV